MKYTKYKNRYKISCFGRDDIWRARAESQYRTPGAGFTNGKTCRFNLNGAFNDVILSKNARLILESTFFPTLTNANAYVNIRIATSSQDKVFDTAEHITGNPILVTFPATNQTIINNSDVLYSFNVPSTFLSQGYIDVEIESPIVTANITFTSALDRFMLTFVIVEEDEEEIQDATLAPKVEYKNFGRLGAPIRTPLS